MYLNVICTFLVCSDSSVTLQCLLAICIYSKIIDFLIDLLRANIFSSLL